MQSYFCIQVNRDVNFNKLVKVAGLEGSQCNQDTLTGPKGGWIRGSSL